MSWRNILGSFTCGRAKMPPRSLALTAGAITQGEMRQCYSYQKIKERENFE